MFEKALIQLPAFQENSPVTLEEFEELKENLRLFDRLNEQEKNCLGSAIVEVSRGYIRKLLTHSQALKDIKLTELYHKLMLDLAKYYPLNDEDPVTLEEIPEKDKVYISTGHQYSLTEIIKWHLSRQSNEKISEEDKQLLFNCLTQQPFDVLDSYHINKIATARGLVIRNLRLPLHFTQPSLFNNCLQLIKPTFSRLFSFFSPIPASTDTSLVQDNGTSNSMKPTRVITPPVTPPESPTAERNACTVKW